ncbi:vacuolar protein sorting-associated protein 26B-like isoform X3 [Pyrus x bretschneideri]|uniref:vacuolar protein sorting-associated protein 26B-like isoform X3 n=1 Tax=Pyrus x bretschneideri TaxID=225117 RepID=UPI00202DF873|nr:vacuolar protein sorting-associated protein 26B-like isoform X3 [Pyrus x bretschneideri]
MNKQKRKGKKLKMRLSTFEYPSRSPPLSFSLFASLPLCLSSKLKSFSPTLAIIPNAETQLNQMEVRIEDCLHIEFEYNKSQSQQEIPLLNLMFTIQRA